MLTTCWHLAGDQPNRIRKIRQVLINAPFSFHIEPGAFGHNPAICEYNRMKYAFKITLFNKNVCSVHEMLLIRELTTTLNVQSDSVQAKLLA